MNEHETAPTFQHVPEQEPAPAPAPAPKGARIATLVVSVLTFLIPTLFIPASAAPFQFSKTLVVVVGTALLYAFFVFTSVRKGVVVKYWSLPLIAFSLLPVVYGVAAVFSQSPSLSFFGYQLEGGTFGFMLLAVLFVNGVVLTISRAQLTGVLRVLLYAAWAVLLFQLAQVLLGTPFGLSLLENPITNPIGKWNDLGMFAGLVGALALLAQLAVRVKTLGQVLLALTFFVALFFLMLVNIGEAWMLFGVVSFGLLVMLLGQVFRNGKGGVGVRALVMPAIGVGAAVFFMLWGGVAATALQQVVNVQSLEVRPSMAGTVGVMQQVYTENAVLGTGPNTFSADWLLYRPDGVLTTIFWNSTFTTGSGTIPTAFVTGGVVTGALWVLFSLLLIYTIIRALFIAPVDAKLYAASALTGVGSLYLLAMHYVYAPSQSLTLLFALFLGLFFVSLKDTPFLHRVQLHLTSPYVQRTVGAVAVVVIILAVASVYGVARTYASAVYHERALTAANNGDLQLSGELVETALSLRDQDRYHRTAALINVAQINRIVEENEVTEEAVQRFQDTLASAVRHANTAVEANTASYENWITRAIVYSAVVPLQIDGAFENAVQTLEEARKRSPKNPEIDYRLAQLHITVGASQLARPYLEAAISRKQNYTQAILALAQIDLNAGALDEAIESVRAAAFFEPDNPVLLYQLGILLLQDQNYEEAALAFEAALSTQPDYANAAFFLAQSYAFLGRETEAAQLMAAIAAQNPDNPLPREYAQVLQSGDNPFNPGEVASPEEEEEVVE